MKNKENKKAHYTCAIVLVYPDGKTLSAEGYLHGEITENRAGTNGFGYDPYFYLPEYGCTTAELDPEIKNKINKIMNDKERKERSTDEYFRRRSRTNREDDITRR